MLIRNGSYAPLLTALLSILPIVLNFSAQALWKVTFQLNMDPLRGIIPDYPVESTQEDLIRGRDTVLEYALSLAMEH